MLGIAGRELLRYLHHARRLAGALAFLMLAGTGLQAQAPESVTVTGALERQPLSVASFTAAALQEAGVTDLSSLGQRVPALRVDRYGASIQPTLRGIGVQNVLGPGVESDVAV
jgi:hypothetical protein